MDQTLEEILEHHGVKGMKWGKRRKRGKDGRVSDESKQKTKFTKAPTRLSDAELNRRIKRLEMEKRYSELNVTPPSEGRSMATRILKKAGEQSVTRAVDQAFYFTIKKAVEKQFGEKTSKQMFGG